MEDYYLIAKVTAVSGKKGFVKIHSYSDFPGRFFELKYVYADFFNQKKILFIEDVKTQKNNFLLKFKNFDSDVDAGFLMDKELFVDKENLMKLEEDQFFIHDLIGSVVFKDGVLIGTITDVMILPANDVYVLTDPEGNELLIPALKEMILEFDAEEKLLVLKPGDELYDEN